MRELWNRIIVSMLNAALRVFRLPGLNSPKIYAIWGAAWMQPIAEHLGRRRALDVFQRARRNCPAYRAFIAEHLTAPIHTLNDFQRIPETTKDNYVKAYSIEDRCHHGRIPTAGVIIDESSGSSGTPNNWVRGADERSSIARLLRHAFRLRFEDRPTIFLNCFALGPWATGMNVSMAMADATILKSIGPDTAKLANTLQLFGPKYEYVVAGYPPFIKDWIDRSTFDLTPYRLHLICGGEGYSLELRSHFEKVFHTIISSYGASDLEINIAAETELSIALRKKCHDDPQLCQSLFGRSDPPMVFQYNPLDYLVEQSEQGELVITLLRRATVAPKIRYNIRDLGGSITFREASTRLREHHVDINTLVPRHMALPFLFVYGRNDLSVPFYGAKVFSTDLERILSATPELRDAYVSFQLEVEESSDMERTLHIHFERKVNAPSTSDDATLSQLLFDKLCEVNQDFREVSKLFTPAQIKVHSHDHRTGPFAGYDIRLKRTYIRTGTARSS